MNPHAKTFWTLRSKNRMMIELIQEVLASEDGDDIDWDSWDARAKEVLRANNVTIPQINKKRKDERVLHVSQEKSAEIVAQANGHFAEYERALDALANGPESSVYIRSLIKSAERRKQALSALNAKTQEKSAD